MALYKELTLKSGIPVSHWVIRKYTSNRDYKGFDIVIVPYVSKQVYDNGGAPIDSEAITINIVDLEYPKEYAWKDILHYTKYFSPEALAGKNIYDVMYNYLKSNIEFFKDAVDA